MDIILKSIIMAGTCSLIAFLTHLMLSLMRQGRHKDEPMILELRHQKRLLITIWLLTTPLYVWLFFQPALSGGTLLSKSGIPIQALAFCYGIIFYFFLSFIYLTLYYFVDRSISATILEIIYSSPDKKLTLDGIKKIYNIEKKYEREIKGMMQGKFIIQEEDYFKGTFKGILYGRLANSIKYLLKLGRGG